MPGDDGVSFVPETRDAQRRHAVIIERRRQALELRKAFKSYREIGAQLGVSAKCAHEDVQVAMSALLPIELAEEVRRIESDRLDALCEACIAILEHPEVKVADKLTAIARANSLMERRAKLLGLDAPTQVEHSGTVEVVTQQRVAAMRDELEGRRLRSA